ncbi:MAG: hypothetical protein AABY45_03230 [Deltaproteobacteria bacterium]
MKMEIHRFLDKAREVAAISYLTSIKRAEELYRHDSGGAYTADFDALENNRRIDKRP